jgi:FMN phosphatase YigB (HAD superfamily)
MTAALFSNPAALREIREHVTRSRPDLKHDLSAIRREAIRLALYRAAKIPCWPSPRSRCSSPSATRSPCSRMRCRRCEFLSGRYPLVAVSNGNADVKRIGIASYFKASISAQQFGVGKPDPRIFHAAARRGGRAAGGRAARGRRCDAGRAGRAQCGMQTVWVNRSDQLWAHPAVPHETVTTLTELCDLFPR